MADAALRTLHQNEIENGKNIWKTAIRSVYRSLNYQASNDIPVANLYNHFDSNDKEINVRTKCA